MLSRIGVCATCYVVVYLFFLMIRRPPRSTRTDTLFPYTTLFRSARLGRLDKAKCGLTPIATEVWEGRSEEHTSELQSLMRISYAVFCLKKKKIIPITTTRLEPNVQHMAYNNHSIDRLYNTADTYRYPASHTRLW